MQLVVEGLLTHYQATGSGPVVVLLHGWGDSSSTFQSLEHVIKKNFTVVSIDLPGFGTTERPDRPYTLADYVDFVAKTLKKTEYHQIYAFIGHSNGGSIAIKGLSTDKLQADKLILLASAGIRSRSTLKQSIYKVIAKMVKLPLHVLPEDARNNTRKKIYKLIGSDLFVAEGMEDTFKNVVSEDLLSTAAALKIKTLLVYGSDDTATPPLFGSMYKEVIKSSELKIIDNAGHFLHLDKPNETNQAVAEFLAS